uniref:AATF leucine zipper-containing domain-containing protein n=1 Tax=Setaria viridis TaxID=4556 RepID=A0A4U6V562_SETVI|nr:hypothetical protein SEVIR_3G044300v2 [Setaria viridis]
MMNQHREEDALRGRAVNNRSVASAIWDKTLEMGFLLQKAFSTSNKQELIKARFCNHDKEVEQAYRDLFDSSKQTLGSMMKLQEVTTGAAALKGKLHAFNQSRSKASTLSPCMRTEQSDQVAGYMRDPSRMINRMHLTKSAVSVFGEDAGEPGAAEGHIVEGDPELIDDSEFYHQLLKEFLESCDRGASESAFYALQKQQVK